MRKKFLINVMLMLVWVALSGNFTYPNLIFGFVLGFIALWVSDKEHVGKSYFKFLPNLVSFVLFFLYELIIANIQVAYEVMTPHHKMKPGIVGVTLDAKTDLEITILSNFIALTPGTLSLHISEDRDVLYIHAMYLHDKEQFVSRIKNGFERKILELLR